MRVVLLTCCFVLGWITGGAQSFSNSELNGSVNFISVPTGWTQIPDTDPICLANSSAEATVDILDTLGPSLSGGVAGRAYSGGTFCSGLHSTDGGSYLWHEGIMQTVGGFTIGNTYSISFFQSVVKQQNAIDESGSWRVYLDGTLLATTTPSTSTLAYDDVELQWDCRAVTFTATATSHTIKFIPWDDDGNQLNDPFDVLGGLRMGIDLITFTTSADPTILTSGPFCLNDQPFNFTAVDAGGTWSGTGITDAASGTFNPAVSGTGNFDIIYTLPVGCATVADTVTIAVNKPPDAAMVVPGVQPCDTLCVQFTDVSIASAGTITGWFWDFGDGGTAMAQDTLYCYSTPGLYDVSLVVTTDVGCMDTIEVVGAVEVNYCAGLAEEEFGSAFSVYPNPTGGLVYLDLGKDYTDVNVRIRNVLGQTISMQTFAVFRKTCLEINGASGLYFVEVGIEGKRPVTLKLIKQ